MFALVAVFLFVFISELIQISYLFPAYKQPPPQHILQTSRDSEIVSHRQAASEPSKALGSSTLHHLSSDISISLSYEIGSI